MAKTRTDYEVFEQSSLRNRRLLREEELILEVTEALSRALAEEGLSKTELAKRLGKTKGFVSQVLAGGRNLTLRTLADIADALGCRPRLVLSKEVESKELESRSAPKRSLTLPVVRPAVAEWTLPSDWQHSAMPETAYLGVEAAA